MNKLVKENIQFKRGIIPKRAMELGKKNILNQWKKSFDIDFPIRLIIYTNSDSVFDFDWFYGKKTAEECATLNNGFIIRIIDIDDLLYYLDKYNLNIVSTLSLKPDITSKV